jgi:hypothetical protein
MAKQTLVSNEAQVLDNIQRFGDELERSPDLQSYLSYFRAWYTGFESDGSYSFGPSKFIGYRNLTAEDYIASSELDGRQTESRLAKWFVEIGPEHIAYEPLREQLHDFLAEYGKAPSSAMRINIPISVHDSAVAEYAANAENGDRLLGDLLIAVALRLPHAERQRVRAAL